MVFVRSEMPIMRSTPSHRRFPNVPFETVSVFVWLTVALSRPFEEDRLAIASLLQAIDGVMSLALCPLVVSQAPQHFRSCEKEAACEGFFAHQSICSVISLNPGMSRAVHPHEFWKVDIDQWHIPVWASHSTFCSKLIEYE